MVKKMWTQPMATVQKFIANEYIAACWGVKCVVTGTHINDEFGNETTPNTSHRAQFCGDPTHYQIKLNANNVPESMTEISTDGLGDLPCTLYENPAYTTVKDISTVKANDYLYWTTDSTKGGYKRVWHHHGPVSGTTNHS